MPPKILNYLYPEPEAPIDHAPGPLALTEFSQNRARMYRRFAADRDTLFTALNDAELMPQWMGAPTHVLSQCAVDFRRGGQTRLSWSLPSGPSGVTISYQDIEPPGRTVHSEAWDGAEASVLVTTLVLPHSGGSLMCREFWYQSAAERDAALASSLRHDAEAAFTRLDMLLSDAIHVA